MHAGRRFVAGQRKSSRGLKMHIGRRFVAGQSRPGMDRFMISFSLLELFLLLNRVHPTAVHDIISYTCISRTFSVP